MSAELAAPVEYRLVLSEQYIPINQYIGKKISLRFTREIHCIHCGRETKKSFSQGFCYPCFKKLAQCDSCILKPETCHFDAGTCREPDWAKTFCMTDHIVYLANSSGVKVGITRLNQVPTRWIDQGAIQALPIFRVDTRYRSGLVENLLRGSLADKTNWRAMLKGDVGAVDLVSVRDKVFSEYSKDLQNLQAEYGLQALTLLEDSESVDISYPVLEYPQKISSLNADKTPEFEGMLNGIKGQYLILDIGVINLRKYAGYGMTFECHS